ncbi:MAG: DinB family protein [Gemmatimonadota bacterium]
MPYEFLVDTYATERLKVLGVWCAFRDEDLEVRPHPSDRRGRNLREHMVHQCVGEDGWFRKMLGIDVGAPPLPEEETRLAFIQRYAEDSRKRSQALRGREDLWWREEAPFFEVVRSRAWILVRRIAHTAHHRGQQTALLRMLGRDVWSTYGPTADTGGLPTDGAPTQYPYPDEASLLAGEAGGAGKRPLPGPGPGPCTERG